MTRNCRTPVREAVADGKTVEAVVGVDVNAFAAAWIKEVRTPKPLEKHLLDWTYILVLAATMVLPWQHLRHWTPDFPVYWGTLAQIGLIALVVQVALRPGPLVRALLRGARQWRALLVAGTVYVVFIAISVLLEHHIRSGHQAVLFVWSWPTTVGLVLVAAVVVWIAFRRDPTRPLPPPNKGDGTAIPETTSSFTEKCRGIWTDVSPFVLMAGIIASLSLIRVRDGQVENSIENSGSDDSVLAGGIACQPDSGE